MPSRSANPLRVLRIADELPAVGFLRELKSVLVLNVFRFHLLDAVRKFLQISRILRLEQFECIVRLCQCILRRHGGVLFRLKS